MRSPSIARQSDSMRKVERAIQHRSEQRIDEALRAEAVAREIREDAAKTRRNADALP